MNKRRRTVALLLLISGLSAVFGFFVHNHYVTRHERAFRRAFDRAVADCRSDRSLAFSADASEAADRCESAEERRAVEEHCLKALSLPDYERWVACHVLYSRRAILPDTLRSLRGLAATAADGRAAKDIHVLIQKFEVTFPHTESDKAAPSRLNEHALLKAFVDSAIDADELIKRIESEED